MEASRPRTGARAGHPDAVLVSRKCKMVAGHDIGEPQERGVVHVDDILRIAAQPAYHAGIPDKILTHLWGASRTGHPCDIAALTKLRGDLGGNQPDAPPGVQRRLGDECCNPSHARRAADPVMH
jgi:hypothetical protein